MAVVCHEAVSFMSFSTADYTRALTRRTNTELRNPNTQAVSFFAQSRFPPRRRSRALAKPSRHRCVRLGGRVWQTFGASLFSPQSKLSRSEWPLLRCRLRGPGQDTGLQDCENCFTSRLPSFHFFLACGRIYTETP